MSGGSHNYGYRQVKEFIESVEVGDTIGDNPKLTPLRIEFLKHLRLVAEAMKAIEWVDSGDCSPPHDEDAIRRALEQ